jgi:hypothetical protein
MTHTQDGKKCTNTTRCNVLWLADKGFIPTSCFRELPFVHVLARSAWAIGTLDLKPAVTGEAKKEGGKRMNNDARRGLPM